MDKMLNLGITKILTLSDIETLIPKCLINTDEDDLYKVVFFYSDISNKFRNDPGVTGNHLIKLIIHSILKEKKGNVNNINLYLLIGLKKSTIQHVELSRGSIIQILLSETKESKRMDKVNTVLANINNNLPAGLRDLFPVELKKEITANLMNVEAFGNCEGAQEENHNITRNDLKTKLDNLKNYNTESVDYANYIDTEEDYAIGLDGTIYYYNPVDGTLFKLTEKQINGTSPEVLNQIYKHSKITKQNMDNALYKAPLKTAETVLVEYDGEIGGMTKGEFALLIVLIIIIICVIVVILYYFIMRMKQSKINNYSQNLNLNNI